MDAVTESAAAGLGEHPSVDDLAGIPADWRRYVEDWLVPLLGELHQIGTDAIAQPIPTLTAAAAPIVAVPCVANETAEHYLSEATNRMVRVGDELWAKTRDELLEGFKLGESIPELQARVSAAGGFSAGRGTLVARTEAISASNTGSYQQMQATGLVTTKTWLATEDHRTRPDHREIDGAKAGLTEAFMVGGWPMQHPGDVDGPASEVCNCRCTVTFDVADDDVQALAGVFDQGQTLADWEQGLTLPEPAMEPWEEELLSMQQPVPTPPAPKPVVPKITAEEYDQQLQQLTHDYNAALDKLTVEYNDLMDKIVQEGGDFNSGAAKIAAEKDKVKATYSEDIAKAQDAYQQSIDTYGPITKPVSAPAQAPKVAPKTTPAPAHAPATSLPAQPLPAGTLTGERILSAAPINYEKLRTTRTITQDQQLALGDYRGSGYININGALRKTRGDLSKVDNAYKTRDEIERIDAVMRRSKLKHDVQTMRGTRDPRKMFGNDWSSTGDMTGVEWIEDAYWSTSADESIAMEFSGLSGFDESVLFRIHVPKGTQAVNLSNPSYEAELLLQRGLRYRVTHDYGMVERHGRRMRVFDVEVVGHG